MASSMGKPTHLDPSKLGTREYWDTLYQTELANHASDPTDEGTVWFDSSSAETRLLGYLDSITESATFEHEVRREDSSFLDLGCGNGSLLLALREDGWLGRMKGVDYSLGSVELARRVERSRRENGGRVVKKDEEDDESEQDDEDEEMELDTDEKEGNGNADTAGPEEEGDDTPAREIEFDHWDVLNGSLSSILSGRQSQGWDVILDKGTFDAVCLSSETDTATGKRVCEGYRSRVLRLLAPGGLFLVTSCNWTEEELKSWFETEDEREDGKLLVAGRVAYPSFRFGGSEGQAISTLCFRKER